MKTVYAIANGQMTLEELESAIQFKEAQSFQFQSISIYEDGNSISFEELPIGEIPHNITISRNEIVGAKKLILGPTMVLISGRAETVYFFRG